MAAKSSTDVVILSMHIIGDRSGQCDEFGAGRDRQEPCTWNGQCEEFGEGNSSFGTNDTFFPICLNQPIELSSLQQMTAFCQATIPIASTVTVGQRMFVLGAKPT
ncbi:hypothetical protein D3C78_1161150 [compost metagenome]